MVYFIGILFIIFGALGVLGVPATLILFFGWIYDKVKYGYADESNVVISTIFTILLGLMTWGSAELGAYLYEKKPTQEYEIEVLYLWNERDTLTISGKLSPYIDRYTMYCDGTVVKGVEHFRIINKTEIEQ